MNKRITLRSKFSIAIVATVAMAACFGIYLSESFQQSRLDKALDAAALGGSENFDAPIGLSPTDNRELVATTIRDTAAINDPAFATLSKTPTVSPSAQNVVTEKGEHAKQYRMEFDSSQPGPSLIVLLQADDNDVIIHASISGEIPFFLGPLKGRTEIGKLQPNYRQFVLVIDRKVGPGLGPAVNNYMSWFDPRRDLMGIVSYEDKPRLDLPLTSKWNLPNQNLASTNFRSESSDAASLPEEAVQLAIKQFQSAATPADSLTEKVIVLVCASPWRTGSAERLIKIAALARQQDISICTIGYGPNISDSQCLTLAEISNCQTYQTTNYTQFSYPKYSPLDTYGTMFYAGDDKKLIRAISKTASSFSGVLAL